MFRRACVYSLPQFVIRFVFHSITAAREHRRTQARTEPGGIAPPR
jgi:hypothetical protein